MITFVRDDVVTVVIADDIIIKGQVAEHDDKLLVLHKAGKLYNMTIAALLSSIKYAKIVIATHDKMVIPLTAIKFVIVEESE